MLLCLVHSAALSSNFTQPADIKINPTFNPTMNPTIDPTMNPTIINPNARLLQPDELNATVYQPGTGYSKLTLVVIEAVGLGCCGIDRCYMGSCCLGSLKGFTLGGFFIWAIVDYLIVMLNAATRDSSVPFGVPGYWLDSNLGGAAGRNPNSCTSSHASIKPPTPV